MIERIGHSRVKVIALMGVVAAIAAAPTARRLAAAPATTPSAAATATATATATDEAAPASETAAARALRTRDEEVARLIEQLGDASFQVRQQAQEELARRGFEVFDALSAAEEHDDIEIASRARYLIRSLRIDWLAVDDPPEIQELLREYDDYELPERLTTIRELARLPDDAGLPALLRLLRFERSAVLSKRVALEFLLQSRPADDVWQRRVARIKRDLADSHRPAADWLRVYIEAEAEPATAVERWTAYIAGEQQTLGSHPERSGGDLIAAMLRYQVQLLERLERRDEMLLAMRRMVDFEPSDAENLSRLVEWLAGHEAWSVVDEVATRFEARFRQEPMLLYSLAEARLAQGDADQAHSIAAQAATLQPRNTAQHLKLGQTLRRRGLFSWAEVEFRLVTDLGPTTHSDVVQAQFQLADMLHDLSRELAAAEVLDNYLKALEEVARQETNAQNAQRLLEVVRGILAPRMHYFFSNHWAKLGDRSKQLAHLEQAMAIDPRDADVLIALYHLPDQDPARQAKTRESIEAAARYFRAQIQRDPRDATPYNQLAWLISNTAGNFDEAIRLSMASLELRPNDPGFQDTLARCYFAAGDLASAVKYQSLAIEQEPHSQQMRRQYDQFVQALAEASESADAAHDAGDAGRASEAGTASEAGKADND